MTRRQFDIIVLSKEPLRPQVEDNALGWFSATDFSEILGELDAEWVVMATPGVRLDREFLNGVADACAEFPFADAIAPRILSASGKTFSSGFLIEKKDGLSEEFLTNEKGEIRQVASLSPECGVYSSRLLKALRGFDRDFKTDIRFFDLGLRAMHLGAKLFAMPRLSASSISDASPSKLDRANRLREISRAYYKDLDLPRFFRFLIRHPGTFPAIFHGKKSLDKKSAEATELSKLTPEILQRVTAK